MREIQRQLTVHPGISGALRKITADDLAALPKERSRSTHPVVRLVYTPDEMEAVYRITHDAYLDYGYITPQPDGRLAHHPELDVRPETFVFGAFLGDQLVGTITVAHDNPAGLQMERDFPVAIATARGEGRTLASSWRIAVSRAHRENRRILMEMIRHAILHVTRHRIGTIFYTFNPRHVEAYRKLIGARVVEEQKSDIEGLVNAPSVLMRTDLEDFPKRWFSRTERAMRDAAVAQWRSCVCTV